MEIDRGQSHMDQAGVSAGVATISPARARTAAAPPADDRPFQTLSLRDFAIAGALALLAGFITGDAWRDILRLGVADEELSYVLLAPVVIAWLAWSRRAEFLQCRPRGQWLGVVILLMGWLTYWYGFRADPVVWRAGAVVIVVGAIAAATGGDVLKHFAPAFLACVFLIPILPNGRYRLAIPLQKVTAHATQVVCDILGMSVQRSGSLLSINGVDVTIAEACNGMRMVLTLFMVCYTVAFTTQLRPAVRALFLLASPLVAIVANVVRLVPTIWMFGNRSAETAERFHTASGWVMSVLAFLLLLGFCRLLERATGSAAAAGAPARTKEAGQ
jgi:exosortase